MYAVTAALQIAVLVLGLFAASLANAQPRPPAPPDDPFAVPLPSALRKHSALREERNAPFPLLLDALTSGPAGPGVRQFIINDMREHVPLLYSRWEATQQIQRERQQLNSDKRRIARGGPKTQSELHRFHELLKREDGLTSRQRDIVPATIRDAEKIRVQVRSRRSQIARLLTESSGDAPSTRTRALARTAAFYDFLDQRFGEIQDDPNPQKWSRPFLKGVFFNIDEHPSAGRKGANAARRLRELQEEQERLNRRLEHVQREIDELTARTGGEEPGGPRGPRSLQHPRNAAPRGERKAEPVRGDGEGGKIKN